MLYPFEGQIQFLLKQLHLYYKQISGNRIDNIIKRVLCTLAKSTYGHWWHIHREVLRDELNIKLI